MTKGNQKARLVTTLGGWRFNAETLERNEAVKLSTLELGEAEMATVNGKEPLDEDARPESVSDDDMPMDLAMNDNPDLRLRIGRYLGGVRKLKKVSQEKAAAELGVSRPHLSNIEQGRSRTGWKVLREMATYYGYGIRALIEEVGKAMPPRDATDALLADNGYRPRQDAPPAPEAAGLQTFSEEEVLVLSLFKMLDGRDRKFIAQQMLQLVQARVSKLGDE